MEPQILTGMKTSSSKFIVDDLIGDHSLFSFIYKKIGIDSIKQLFGLFFVIIIPFLFLIPFTIRNNVFYYGSVITEIDKVNQDYIFGMSFLGDTMVWPYVFIVPLCLVLTKVAIKRSTTLLNRVVSQINPEWKKDDASKYGYRETILKTKIIFKMGEGWYRKFFLILPWIIALLFIIYNADSCSYQLIFPYPYNTALENKISIIQIENFEALKKLELAKIKDPLKWDKKGKKVPIPKWDCDPKNATLSWLGARIWSVFYYGIIPFIFIRLIVVICGVTYFLSNIIRWESSKDATRSIKVLIIEPFSSDGFGGLKYLADTGMGYLYSLCSFALLIAMFFLKEAATPSWHNYLMMSLIPLEIFAFLMPVIILRSSILKSKMDYLSSLLFQINSLSSSIIQNRREDNLSEYSGENNFYQLSSMKIIYDQVRNISEWPFTLSTFIRIVISIGMPLLLAFLQQIVKKYV